MVQKREDLNVTVGPLLIGCLVTAVYALPQIDLCRTLTERNARCRGYGIATMQSYMYWSRFPRDPKYIKAVVSCPREMYTPLLIGFLSHLAGRSALVGRLSSLFPRVLVAGLTTLVNRLTASWILPM